MDTELQVLRDFLATHHPFDQLPEDVLASLPTQLEEVVYSKSDIILEPGGSNAHLYIVRSGAVEIREPDGSLLGRRGEGDMFGQRSLLRKGVVEVQVQALENTLLYRLPGEVFHSLCREHAQFRYFFGAPGGGRLRTAMQSLGQDDSAGIDLLTTPVGSLLKRPPITLPSTTSIRVAAERMTADHISSLLVADTGQLVGIVTDRDLRSRVVAKGLSYERPLSEIMTTAPATVAASAYIYEALLLMARNGYHHLPVMREDSIAGMITATDLLQRRTTSPLYLIADIYKRQTLPELVEVSQRLPQLLLALVTANASAHSIGHVISSVGEALTCRLLVLAEEQLGAPPVPYAWLVGGSMARREQTAHSDQDNCLLLADTYREEAHGAYFEQLARFVCDGLNACGYVYCPGDIMAVTPRWRQPLAVWKGYFTHWIDQPEPKALMHSSIFFDLRCLAGDSALFEELQAHFLDKARQQRIFQAFMAANALHHQPPLGFFRSFVLVKDGKHDRTLDLKHSGVVPVIDLGRLYALTGGIAAVNTRDRLEAAEADGIVSHEGAADLRDALEFIGSVRLRHQARQIQQGKAPDNYLSPKDLSHFERNHLRDAFSAVSTIQSSLSQRYQLSRFG